MWNLWIILVILWVQRSQEQTCPPVPTIPPHPVDVPRGVLKKLLGAWATLRGSWGKWKISFRPPPPLERYTFKVDKKAKDDCDRQEYRQLSKQNLRNFHRAMNEFHASPEFESFINEHDITNAPNAHFGCSFVCWHRHYLHVLEQALRKLNRRYRKLCLPYWDSAMDHGLPSPKDSALWTKFYWGKGEGVVDNGKLCPDWTVTPGCTEPGAKVTRHVTGDRDFLYSRESINNLMAFGNFCSIQEPVERNHGLVHCYVGQCGLNAGHMANIPCAPNDAVFFLLHVFVDCLWYEWCDQKSIDCTYCEHCEDGHRPNDPMLPFPGLNNVDGCREDYYKRCTKRPSLLSCARDKDCKSPSRLLFCHECRCMGKVAPQGNCTGLPDNACYCHNRKQTPECGKNNKCICKK